VQQQRYSTSYSDPSNIQHTVQYAIVANVNKLSQKNDTDVATITSMHINRFWQFLAEVLLKE